MIPIFICEDEPNEREYLKTVIERYIKHSKLPMKLILSTGNPQVIIKYINNNSRKKGVYFIDLDLNDEVDGVWLSRKIREKDAQGKIIMITAHKEFAHLIFKYKLGVLDYIIKGELQELTKRVENCLLMANSQLQDEMKNTNKELYEVKNQGETWYFPITDVLFFESLGNRKISLYGKNKRVIFNGLLKEIVKSNEKFFYCHKSFVVNVENIKSICRQNSEIEMTNGERCPIATKKIGRLREAIATKK